MFTLKTVIGICVSDFDISQGAFMGIGLTATCQFSILPAERDQAE